MHSSAALPASSSSSKQPRQLLCALYAYIYMLVAGSKQPMMRRYYIKFKKEWIFLNCICIYIWIYIFIYIYNKGLFIWLIVYINSGLLLLSLSSPPLLAAALLPPVCGFVFFSLFDSCFLLFRAFYYFYLIIINGIFKWNQKTTTLHNALTQPLFPAVCT